VTGKVEHRHLNINGVVHGGVYATILDTAMGAAVVTLLGPGETTATTSLYVEFLRAAREGDHLTARGGVLRRGRHIAFVEGISPGPTTAASPRRGARGTSGRRSPKRSRRRFARDAAS